LPSNVIADLTPTSVSQRLQTEDPPLLLDVREPWERQVAAIPGTLDIPMNEIPARLAELPADRDIVVVCHHGARSLQVAMWLGHQGFDRVANLDGGIDAWSRQVDPSVPLY
jgi:rhodanese-related sulfurtransferase